jgi:hypothetical protein
MLHERNLLRKKLEKYCTKTGLPATGFDSSWSSLSSKLDLLHYCQCFHDSERAKEINVLPIKGGLQVSEFESVRILFLPKKSPKSESVRIWKFQNLNVSETESVRIWKCQNFCLSERVRIWKCQNLYLSESVRIWKFQNLCLSESVRKI